MVGLAAAGTAAARPAHASAAATKVTVTIKDSQLLVRPSYAPPGKVVFTVLNRAHVARDFGLGSKRTKAIAAGHSASLTVRVGGLGEHTLSSLAKGHIHPLTGALDLFKPCTNPVTSTVSVTMGKSGIALSPSTVPCGTVTFNVTDSDAPATSLLVSLNVPPLSGVTDQLQPGGTATITLPFAARASARCEAIQNDSNGDIVLVGSASLTLS